MHSRVAAQTRARPDVSHRRALFIALGLVLWMVAIGGRLIYLQTMEHDWLTTRARAQQEEAIETSPIRGMVLDRQGRELARSILAQSFFAVPGEIGDPQEVATRLAPFIKED